MHVPPYYKRKDWQRFMVGVFVGGMIGYLVFLFMYGEIMERFIEENLRVRTERQELQLAYDTLEQNLTDLNQKYQEQLTINSIKIVINNAEVFKLDRFMLHELGELIKAEVNDIIGKEVVTLNDYYPILIRMIENKAYKIDGFSYQAKVAQLFINEQTEIHIELDLDR
ncbi:hypothetical protein SAMN04488134_11454 [Amphibacillus marinus]|uniref:Sporulation membrane protein YtrI C-terminal domain-containing protein n=1 Tax=Amphibacillus marinus TaxID=872970 RepID=A0A1H8T2L4_9BACI|nr:sporulation membrane protein YtrI [Amphibacillus marinus]SEO85167.1 hypothetical protein SAMN04488134_11454 [Amphibacillus marinus]